MILFHFQLNRPGRALPGLVQALSGSIMHPAGRPTLPGFARTPSLPCLGLAVCELALSQPCPLLGRAFLFFSTTCETQGIDAKGSP